MAIKDAPKEEEKEVVEAPVEETEKPQVVEQTEETVEETPVEETQEAPEEKENKVVEVKIDPEEIAANIKKQYEEKILKSLGITKEEEKKAEDEGYKTPWEKRGEVKPASWQEAIEAGAELAEWKRKEEDKQIAKAQEDQEKEAKEQTKKWNDYWDSELDELAKSGKIPAVKDEKDPNDPGRKARIKMFAKMKELGEKSRAENKPPITSLKLIFYEHYEPDVVPGADAPVSFGKKGVTSGEGPEYTYEEIHSKTFDQLKDK